MYDVIIVGGGPSGMLAAIGARSNGAEVLLIDKNTKLGKKMLISGGGRCNLSNVASIDKLIENVPGNGRFLYSAFHQFSNNDLIRFFEEELGVKTKVEDKGRVFPESDQSKTIIDAISKYMSSLGIEIKYNTTVQELVINNAVVKGVITSTGQELSGKAVVLATGGISFPKTGSTGEGHELAKKFGHSVSDLFAASIPLISEDEVIRKRLLQGISLHNVQVTLKKEGKIIKAEEGDMIFTHFGVSGPVILRLSRYVSLYTKEEAVTNLFVEIDLLPGYSEEQLIDQIFRQKEESPKKLIINGMSGLLPEKLLQTIISYHLQLENKRMNEMSKKEVFDFVNLIKKYRLSISGTRPITEAVVTGGGINIKEVDPKTFQSKMIEGLYLVGELLDIDAFTGGYNMQVAFSSGYVAGKSASEYCLWQ